MMKLISILCPTIARTPPAIELKAHINPVVFTNIDKLLRLMSSVLERGPVKKYIYLWFGVAVALSVLASPVRAKEICIKKYCFEWPILGDGTVLKKVSHEGVWSKPSGDGPFPALVIAESCGGSNDAVNKDWPAFFNSLGYATYTPRILSTMGHEYCPNLKFVLSNKNRIEMLNILYSALDEISSKPYVKNNDVGIIGFSLGGINIRDAGEIKNLKSAEGRKFNFAIPVYGSCTLQAMRGDRIPTLMIQAEMEKPRKVKSCRKVRDQKFSNVAYHEIKNAYHGFDDKRQTEIFTDIAGNKIQYSLEATNEARRLIKEFLESR